MHHTLNTFNGWLSPEGQLYPCDKGDHYKTCERLVKNLFDGSNRDPQQILERLGWIKLQTEPVFNTSAWIAHRRNTGETTFMPDDITSAQTRVIVEWTHLHNRTTPMFDFIEKQMLRVTA